jgi:ABC-type amino acid transport substrate-binding protein
MAQGPDILIFGTAHEPQTAMYQYASDYLQRLCEQIRQRCQLQSLPGLRGAAMLADGSIAGEMGRVHDYNLRHPEYRRVEEPFAASRTFVFTRADKPAIDSWEELPKKVGTVAYKRGIYIYQVKLEALRPHIQPHDVQSITACLQMVLNGRDEACIFDEGNLSEESKALLKRGHTGRPLDELQLYIYLGRDHAVLADSLTAAVRHLNAKGLKAELQRKYIRGQI